MKLRAKEQLEQDYHNWQQRHQMVLTALDREEILALGENLPRVWNAPTTTSADRKSIIRLVIRDVIVDQDRVQGKVWFQVNWQTESRSEHWYTRRVQSYAAYADGERLEKRVRELHAQQKLDADIASVLNAEGFRTPHWQPFTRQMIGLIRKQWGLVTVVAQGSLPDRWEDGSYSINGIAKRVGVFPGTVYHWVRSGRVEAHQLVKGTPWRIDLDDQKVAELQSYLKRVSRSKREVL
jgi:excisionase family DNA binding protein